MAKTQTIRLVSTFSTLLCFYFSSAKAYWQQHTAYNIVVSLDDQQHMLRGFETIVYTNHSPDTLSFLIFHLWPNAYKNDRTDFCEQQLLLGKTDFYYSAPKDRGFIDSLSFNVDGESVMVEPYKGKEDVVVLQLNKPLLPSQSIEISTPFRVKIPSLYSRLGHVGQSYYISQWYPKPAVYDTQGWHPLAYLDQGEFYSEYGRFDVQISLPKNYVLMATGNCQTISEQVYLDSLAVQPFPSDTCFKKSWPKSAEDLKTVRFTEDKVHDFAWFADKRWLVRKSQYRLNDADTPIAIYSAFLPIHQKQWTKANLWLKYTLQYYSQQVGPYPYKSIKAVEGHLVAGGGMEYPTICVIDQASVSALGRVLVHEAGHNWFYGILGNNERQYPWLDEGLNSFYERKALDFIQKQEPELTSQENFAEDLIYFQQAAQHEDQRFIDSAVAFSSLNYGSDVYNKSTLMLAWLESYVGVDHFKSGIQAYYLSTRFRHPQPGDFRKAIEDNSNLDLEWFFGVAMAYKGPIDYSITKGKAGILKLRNRSSLQAPALVTLYHKNQIITQQWTSPFKGLYPLDVPDSIAYDKAVLGPLGIDFRKGNNGYHSQRLFGGHLFGLGKFWGSDKHRLVTLKVAPAVGYNVYDGFGLGALMHNLGFPQRRLLFALAPIYSFDSKMLNGVAAISYSWFPKVWFQEIRLQSNFKTFSSAQTNLNLATSLNARYIKVAPQLELIFKEKSPISKTSHRLLLRYYRINQEYFAYVQNFSVDSLFRPELRQQQYSFSRLLYQYKNSRTLHPYTVQLDVHGANDFVKLGFEASQRIDYDLPNKSLFVRFFAGGFISHNPQIQSPYWLNTTFTGRNDYLYDGTYIARNANEGFGARQVSLQEGMFKVPTNLYANPLGRSAAWLLALNLKTDLPFGKIPLRFFADFATFQNARQINTSGSPLLFVGGLQFDFFKGALGIYIPFLYSQDFSNYIKEMNPQNRLLNSISFSLNVQQLNFLRAHKQMMQFFTQY